MYIKSNFFLCFQTYITKTFQNQVIYVIFHYTIYYKGVLRLYLKQLLSNPIFSKSVLLTGKLGLDRLVDSVNLMDAPDIIHYVKPGQLLLSNGYFMKKNPRL